MIRYILCENRAAGEPCHPGWSSEPESFLFVFREDSRQLSCHVRHAAREDALWESLCSEGGCVSQEKVASHAGMKEANSELRRTPRLSFDRRMRYLNVEETVPRDNGPLSPIIVLIVLAVDLPHRAALRDRAHVQPSIRPLCHHKPDAAFLPAVESGPVTCYCYNFLVLDPSFSPLLKAPTSRSPFETSNEGKALYWTTNSLAEKGRGREDEASLPLSEFSSPS